MLQKEPKGLGKKELQRREKSGRQDNGGNARLPRSAVQEHLILRSILLRSLSSPGLKSKSDGSQAKTGSTAEPGRQAQGRGHRQDHGYGHALQEKASSSQSAALNTSADVALAASSKSHGHTQAPARGGVYANRKESAVAEDHSPVQRHQAESGSPRSKHSGPSLPSAVAAASLPKASPGLIQRPKPLAAPKVQNVRSSDSRAGDRSKGEPKNQPPKRGRIKPREGRTRRLKAPDEPPPVSITRTPAAAQPPTMADAPEQEDIGPDLSHSEHGESSPGTQQLLPPGEAAPATSPVEAQPSPKEVRAETESVMGNDSPAVPQSVRTSRARSQSAPPGEPVNAGQARRRGMPKEGAPISDAATASGPRARSAPPGERPPFTKPRVMAAVGSSALQKTRKTVKFGDSTTHIIPVDPAHDLRGVRGRRRQIRGSRSGEPYPSPWKDFKKPEIWAGKEWRKGKRLASHLKRQAAVAGYWTRVEQDKVTERQQARDRKPEQQLVMLTGEALSLSENKAPEPSRQPDVELKQRPPTDSEEADDKGAKLRGVGAPARLPKASVPGNGSAKNGTDLASQRRTAARALPPTIGRKPTRDSLMHRRRVGRSAFTFAKKPVPRGPCESGHPQKRKTK